MKVRYILMAVLLLAAACSEKPVEGPLYSATFESSSSYLDKIWKQTGDTLTLWSPEIAKAEGRSEFETLCLDYAAKADAEEIRSAINAEWFDDEKDIYGDGSTALQALALHYGIVPDTRRQSVAFDLNMSVAKNRNVVNYDIPGNEFVAEVLSEAGFDDTAYNVAVRNAYSEEVARWFISGIAGINPGDERILFKPHFPKALEYVSASYQSEKGRITSSWKKMDWGYLVEVDVPAECPASLAYDTEEVELLPGHLVIKIGDSYPYIRDAYRVKKAI